MSTATETIEGLVKTEYKYGFYTDVEAAAHSMHQADPERFVGILSSWTKGLPSPR